MVGASEWLVLVSKGSRKRKEDRVEWDEDEGRKEVCSKRPSPYKGSFRWTGNDVDFLRMRPGQLIPFKDASV